MIGFLVQYSYLLSLMLYALLSITLTIVFLGFHCRIHVLDLT